MVRKKRRNGEEQIESDRYYLDQLLANLSGVKFVKNGTPPEWPDFVVEDSFGLLGIEVTQAFRAHVPERRRSLTPEAEAVRDDRLSEIREAYYAAGGPVAAVTAVQLPTSFVARQRYKQLLKDSARLLAKAARRQGPGPHTVVVPDRTERLESPWARFSLLRVDSGDPSHGEWRSVQNSLAFVEHLRPDLLQACIAKKKVLLPSYRSHLERVALLIYVDRSKGSGMVDPEDDSSLLCDPCGFEAVYLLMHMRVGGPPLLRIDTHRPGPASGPAPCQVQN